jgi:KUP system potassium uptake protein
VSINDFLKNFRKGLLHRVKGTSVFLTPNPDGLPHALLHNIKHNKILHETVIILTVKFMDYPRAKSSEILILEKLPHGFYKVSLNYGFSDEPNIPKDLEKCSKYKLTIEPMNTSYFVGKESLIITPDKKMTTFRKKLFAFMFNSAEDITNQFKLPVNRVVELGAQNQF